MTVQYTDAEGTTHEVGSISAVPRKYVRTMVVIGGEEESEDSGDFDFGGGTATQEVAPRGTREQSGFEGDHNLADTAPALVVGVLLAIFWMIFKGFAARVLIGVAALMAVVFFITSEFYDDSKAITSIEDKQLEAEIGDAAKKKKSTWKDIKIMLDERENKRAGKSLKAGQQAGTSGPE